MAVDQPEEIEAPPGVLSFNGESQVGYGQVWSWAFWHEGESFNSFSATPALGAFSVPEEKLVVCKGALIRFCYGGSQSLVESSARAFPIEAKDLQRCDEPLSSESSERLSLLSGFLIEPAIAQLPVSTLSSGRQIEVLTDLPDGEYAVEVSVEVPQGNVSYSFHIVV